MSDSESAPHHEALLRHGGLGLPLDVFIEPPSGGATSYRVTCTERETGWVLGSGQLPAAPGGGPPVLTLSDLTPLFGSTYRLASILVDLESAQLARLSRRSVDRARRRSRSWLRRTRHLWSEREEPVPYESLLERDRIRTSTFDTSGRSSA